MYEAVQLANDPLILDLTRMTIDALAATGGDIAGALSQVDVQFRRLATHHARVGTNTKNLALAFTLIHHTAEDRMTEDALPEPARADSPEARRCLGEYTAVLADRACASLARAHAREAATRRPCAGLCLGRPAKSRAIL